MAAEAVWAYGSIFKCWSDAKRTTREECWSAKDDTHKSKGVPKRTLETNPTETVGSRFCASLKKVFRLKPSRTIFFEQIQSTLKPCRWNLLCTIYNLWAVQQHRQLVNLSIDVVWGRCVTRPPTPCVTRAARFYTP